MLKKILKSSYKSMPWKNGKGTTVEIFLKHPQATQSSLDGFDWRVSSAAVAESGPFSFFPGYERSIAALNDSLAIEVNGPVMRIEKETEDVGSTGGDTYATKRVIINKFSDPFFFSGDDSTHGELIDGKTVVDFNVITNKAKCVQEVSRVVSNNFEERHQSDRTCKMLVSIKDSLMFCCFRGQVDITTSLDRVIVQEGDSCLLPAGHYNGEVHYTISPASPLLSSPLPPSPGVGTEKEANGEIDVFVVKIMNKE
jgi:environmental stress-induced protein Ves